MRLRFFLAAALVTAACEKFPTPADLEHPTVLAVIADPPVVAPGKTSRLSLVAADHTGQIAPATAWALVATYPDLPPMGRVTANPDGTATYTAPDPVPPVPPKELPVDSVQAQVATEPAVVAIKLVAIVDGVTAVNPTVQDVSLGGASALAGATVAHGTMAALAVTTDGTPDKTWTYAWYSTVGVIDHYQSNPTTLVAADTAGSGWIFVVVRDGRGGTAVRGVQVTVE